MPTQPTPSDVHVNRPLSNISVAYIQAAAGFVADAAFPNIPVTQQSNKYYIYNRADWNRDDMEKRAPATESSGSGYTITTATYTCDQWDHHHDVPDERRANADDPLQPDREAVMLVSHKAMIRREANWASQYFTTSVWDTDITGIASGTPTSIQALQWNDAASTPIEDVEAQKAAMLEASGYEPNTLILQYHVWSALKNHPDLVDRIKYGQTPGSPAIVTLQAVAALMEIDRILVMKGIYNAAKEGLTESNSFIGSKHALLCYAAPNPGLMIPSAGYTFSWNGLLGSSAMGGRITKFRQDALKAYRVEIEMAFDHKVVATDLGCLFAGIVA
jgi:hypothetical protein